MKLFLLIAAIFLVFILPSVAAAETMVVSYLGDPASIKGYNILKAAYGRLGIDLKAETMPHERSLRSANSGETDGDVMRIAGIEAQFSDLIRVPEPVYSFDVVAFSTGLTFKVEGWNSLRPYSLCVARGMRVAEQGTEGMDRTVANSVEQIIEMLRNGRCQLLIAGPSTWLDIDRLRAGPILMLEPPIVSVPLYHLLNRKHAPLVPRLAEILGEMRKDGTIAAIIAEEDRDLEAARRRNSIPGR
jgi:polar amino acid transport system substrate-binding protein